MNRLGIVRGIVAVVGLGIAMLMPLRVSAIVGQLFGATGSNGVDGILYSIDPVTGVATLIGPITVGATGVPLTGLAVHPLTGVLYGVTGGDGNLPGLLLTIDKTTGMATSVGSLGIAAVNCSNGLVADIAFRADGTLFGAGPCGPSTNGNLYTIDLTTGTATFVGAILHGSKRTGFGLSFLPLQGGTQQLFVFPELVQLNLYEINPASGAILNTIALSGGIDDDAINSATTNPAGTALLGVMSDRSGFTTDSLVSVDPATGVITTINALPANMDALALDFGPVQPPITGVPLLSPFNGSGRAFGLSLTVLMLLSGIALVRRAAD